MKQDAYFWILLPIFVAMSGNLAPFRVGPILPIFFLLMAFSILNAQTIVNYFHREKRVFYAAIAMGVFFVAFTLHPMPGLGLRGDEFLGATNPVFYAISTFLRYAICLCSLLTLAHKPYPITGLIRSSLLTTFFILLIPMVLQFLLQIMFGMDFGFVFHTGTGTRYGGLIGEPQTAAAWLTCVFFVLYTIERRTGFPQSPMAWLLLGCQILVLLLTSSTAWILAFGIFMLLRLQRKMMLVFGAASVAALPVLGATIIQKLNAELFQISERSVTIVAGFQAFSVDLRTILFGYGVGLSPYLLGASEIFQLFPDLNLSSLGRQNVMNSYLEIIFEFGVIGAPLFFFLFFRASKIDRWTTAFAIAPVIVGISGVGGGFAAGYLLLAVPLLARLNARENPGRLSPQTRYRLVPTAPPQAAAQP